MPNPKENITRLARVEEKIDKMSEAIVALARVEEKIISLEKSNQFIVEQMAKNVSRLEIVENNNVKLMASSHNISRFMWLLISSSVSAIILLWFTLKMSPSSH